MKKSAAGRALPKKVGAKSNKPGLGSQQVRLAAAMGSVVKSKAKSTHVETGRMYLGQVTTGASPVAGAVYLEVSMFPSDIAPSRLAQLAGMYSRFKWRRAKIVYEPAVGSSTNGSLFMWIDADPTAPVPTVDALGEVSIAHKSSATFPVWSEASIAWSPTLQDKWLYTVASEDPREYSAGIFRVACDTVLAASTTFGRVYLDFDVEFREESLTSAAATLAVEGTSNKTNVNMVNATTYNLLASLAPSTTSGPTMTSGALLDAMPSSASDDGSRKGMLLPPGAYQAEAGVRVRTPTSATNLTGWGTTSPKFYDPSTNADVSAEVESSVEVANIDSPATTGVYMTTFKSVFETVRPLLFDIASVWTGDSNASSTVDQNWTISNIAPLVAKTAAAFLASVPGVVRNVGPTRKLQVCAVDLAVSRPPRSRRGVRYPALLREAVPPSLGSPCVGACATFARDGGRFVCACCGKPAPAACSPY